jgi:hypothetical protein
LVVVEFLQKVTVSQKVVVFHLTLVLVAVTVDGRGVFVLVVVTVIGVVLVFVMITGGGTFVVVLVVVAVIVTAGHVPLPGTDVGTG